MKSYPLSVPGSTSAESKEDADAKPAPHPALGVKGAATALARGAFAQCMQEDDFDVNAPFDGFFAHLCGWLWHWKTWVQLMRC